jgi:hypothetical protein
MQQTHLNTLDMVRRVQGFLDRLAAALGSLIPASLRARLDAAVTQLAAFQVEQAATTGTARGETAAQTALRKDFYTRFMRPIARNAKSSLKNVGEYPTLVVPSSKLRKGEFLGAAQAMADSATKYEKVFLDKGMPTDFLTQMRAAIAQMTASNDARDRNLSRREAATQGIKNTSQVAHEVLVNLDSIIGPALKHDPSMLADWKASKRVTVPTPLPPQPTGLAPAGTTTPVAPVTGATTVGGTTPVGSTTASAGASTAAPPSA